MDLKKQKKTPYLDALRAYLKENIAPFDVPGHHMGNVENDFKKLIGLTAYQCDVNAPRGLDNLNHPTGVIKEAQELMADAYQADEAFFLINGTSSGIMAAMMATCSAYDKVILPRNCHKSVINGLIISGASPIFIAPEYDLDLEIANQPTLKNYLEAMNQHPDAKAIFVINPTYFGACLDLETLVAEAHKRNMIVIADEAHGAHFAFNAYGPHSAMACGADLSAVSLHKTLGSLTQSSILLRKGNRVTHDQLSKTLAIINTTSPSTLLIASLDAARKYMALNGQSQLNDIVNLANYARKEINRISGFRARGREHFMNHKVYDYDDTKLVIELEHIDLTGFELYKILKDEYHIQMELAETYTILGIIAVGSKKAHIDKLINALRDISDRYIKLDDSYPKFHYTMGFAKGVLRPRSAYQAPSKRISIEQSEGCISRESMMIYPPGIPLIIPGEVFTKEIIEHILYYRTTNATIISDYDNGDVAVVDLEKYPEYKENLILQERKENE